MADAAGHGLVTDEGLVEAKAHEAVVVGGEQVVAEGDHGVTSVEVIGVANAKGDGDIELGLGRQNGVHGTQGTLLNGEGDRD